MRENISLITGGAGFIGSELTKFLLKQKKKVICLDNFQTSIQKTEDFVNNINYKLIKHDVTKKINLKCDEIYHLACPASPKKYQENGIKTLKTNFIGTLNMLELAKKNRCKFLLASTSEIYGDPKTNSQKESYFGNVNPVGPRACYDEGKRISETLVYEFRKKYNIDTKIIRIFNAYGPIFNNNDGRVIFNFFIRALNNKDIYIYGNGKQTRSFCYLNDIIEGIYKMMSSKFSGPINLGNPETITILNLAKKIIKKTNSKSKIKFLKKQINDPLKRKPNIELAKKKLKWKPKINLDSGLEIIYKTLL